MNKIQVKLHNVKLSYPKLFEPASFKGSKAAYSATFLIKDEDINTLHRLMSVVHELKIKEWGKDTELLAENVAVKDGNDSKVKEYKNHYFIKSKTYEKPLLKDSNLKDATNPNIINETLNVNAIIEFSTYDSKDFGKGISCKLIAVQFIDKKENFKHSEELNKSVEAVEQNDIDKEIQEFFANKIPQKVTIKPKPVEVVKQEIKVDNKKEKPIIKKPFNPLDYVNKTVEPEKKKYQVPKFLTKKQ